MTFMADDEKKLYSTNDIYEALKIPFRYLRKLMTTLSKTGLIESIQGKFGGYKFTKKIKDISILDIVSATNDSILKNDCFFGFQNCALNKTCAMHDKWASIRENISSVLGTTSLKDIKEAGPHNFISKANTFLT